MHGFCPLVNELTGVTASAIITIIWYYYIISNDLKVLDESVTYILKSSISDHLSIIHMTKCKENSIFDNNGSQQYVGFSYLINQRIVSWLILVGLTRTLSSTVLFLSLISTSLAASL